MKYLLTTIEKQEERIKNVERELMKGKIWRKIAEENIRNAESIISRAYLKLSELKQS